MGEAHELSADESDRDTFGVLYVSAKWPSIA